jgi:hypothetical protein
MQLLHGMPLNVVGKIIFELVEVHKMCLVKALLSTGV